MHNKYTLGTSFVPTDRYRAQYSVPVLREITVERRWLFCGVAVLGRMYRQAFRNLGEGGILYLGKVKFFKSPERPTWLVCYTKVGISKLHMVTAKLRESID